MNVTRSASDLLYYHQLICHGQLPDSPMDKFDGLATFFDRDQQFI